MLSVKNWIFSPLVIAGDIPVLIKEIGQTLVIFLIAGFHLLEEFLLELFRVLHDEITIGIFLL